MQMARNTQFREAVEAIAKEFNLTESEHREMLPSGQQEVFDNRVGWARTYMKKAGLIEMPKRGVNRITKRGLDHAPLPVIDAEQAHSSRNANPKHMNKGSSVLHKVSGPLTRNVGNKKKGKTT